MSPMKKVDIAQRIHQKAGISEQEAATLLDGILELLASTLQKGDPVTIPGFGKFTVRSKLPRTGRNPRTGEAILIAACRV
jgi:DNA-binding protein HU-beta